MGASLLCIKRATFFSQGFFFSGGLTLALRPWYRCSTMKNASVNLRFESVAQHKLFVLAARLCRMSLNRFLLSAAESKSIECPLAPDRKHDWNTVNTEMLAKDRCNFCSIKRKDWRALLRLVACLICILFAPPAKVAMAQVPGLRAPAPIIGCSQGDTPARTLIMSYPDAYTITVTPPDCMIFWKKGSVPLGDLQDTEILFMPVVTDRPLPFSSIAGTILTANPPDQPPNVHVSLRVVILLPCPTDPMARCSPNRELHYEARNDVNQHVNVGTYPVTFVKLDTPLLLPKGTIILVSYHVFIENPAVTCKVICAVGGDIQIAGVQP